MIVLSTQFLVDIFEIGHCILIYGNFIDNVITDQWKVDFEKTALKVGRLSKAQVQVYTSQNDVFLNLKNSSNNLESNYWRFQSM